MSEDTPKIIDLAEEARLEGEKAVVPRVPTNEFEPIKEKPKRRLKPRRKRHTSTEEREMRRAIMLKAREELPVEITLANSHIVNGQSYGPGKVKVQGSLASSLIEQDQRANRAEEEFHGTKAVIIGPRIRGFHVTRQVPVETFDDSMATAEPAVTQRVGNREDSK